MKHAIHILAAVLLASASYALDITTTKGVTYSNVTVKRVEPDGVSITHSTGITKIMFNELTPEDRERFHLDADRARAYNTIQQQRISAAAAKQEESLRKLQEKTEREFAAKKQKEDYDKRARVYELLCWSSDKEGIRCRDYYGRQYIIRDYKAMPETWFRIEAVEIGRVQLGSMSSAMELKPHPIPESRKKKQQ
jgi:hypothetical protein